MLAATCSWGLSTFTLGARAEGIAKCEHALALDRNLAYAHAYIGIGKVFIGRAEETESHIGEALRLSPRDTMAYVWFAIAATRSATSAFGRKRSHGFGGRSKSTEIFRNRILN